MKKYQVIGGQYEPFWYGESDTIRGAKWLATHHVEYWDNWQGWHKPRIYEAEDVETVEVSGWILYPDGARIRVPKDGAMPVNYYW